VSEIHKEDRPISKQYFSSVVCKKLKYVHDFDKQYLTASGCFTHRGVLLVAPLEGFVPAGKERKFRHPVL
jgi:hypothetical protein